MVAMMANIVLGQSAIWNISPSYPKSEIRYTPFDENDKMIRDFDLDKSNFTIVDTATGENYPTVNNINGSNMTANIVPIHLMIVIDVSKTSGDMYQKNIGAFKTFFNKLVNAQSYHSGNKISVVLANVDSCTQVIPFVGVTNYEEVTNITNDISKYISERNGFDAKKVLFDSTTGIVETFARYIRLYHFSSTQEAYRTMVLFATSITNGEQVNPVYEDDLYSYKTKSIGNGVIKVLDASALEFQTIYFTDLTNPYQEPSTNKLTATRFLNPTGMEEQATYYSSIVRDEQSFAYYGNYINVNNKADSSISFWVKKLQMYMVESTLWTNFYKLYSNQVRVRFDFNVTNTTNKFNNVVITDTKYGNKLYATVINPNGLSVKNNTANNETSVYPTIANNVIYIVGGLANQDVIIYNATGNIVKTTTENQFVDISTLPNGAYFVKTAGTTTKIIVQH